jgi:hypothetical protein
MNKKIAIIMQEGCKNDARLTLVTAIVFEKEDALWAEKDKRYVNVLAEGDVAAVREKIIVLADYLGDCQIAAGPDISGILFRELDKRGFSVFETSDVSPDTLDGILNDIQEALTPDESATAVPTLPVETGLPGVYALDLIRLQEAFPELTSRQVLGDFLETPFLELQLTCTHVPPWLVSGPYEISAAKDGMAIRAVIRKKQCTGGLCHDN